MSQDSEKGEIKVLKNYMPWAIVVTIFCSLPSGLSPSLNAQKRTNC